MKTRLLACFLTLLWITSAAAGPKVIASIMPVHSIVAAVMGDTGSPELLLSGSMPEHRASFTAQQISNLGKADLVFIVGGGLEAKLVQISGAEAVGGKEFIQLSRAPGITTHAIREGGNWDDHEHLEEHAAFDPHVWLDPENAKAMAFHVAVELAKADPAARANYETNAKAFASRIDQLSGEITATLAPVKATPFIVFHDAFQYFEKRFGLNAVGAIADFSAAPPSAQRIKYIRDRLSATAAVCVFREPQFDPKLADTVTEGTPAKSGVLDPLGAKLEPGPDAYVQILRGIADNLGTCLSE